MSDSVRQLLRILRGGAPGRWDVMVVPDSANAMPHTYHVSRWMIQAGVGGTLFLVAATVVLWTGSLVLAKQAHRADVEALEQLVSKDRAALSIQMAETQAELKSVREAMTPLLDTENKMRAIAGLKPRYRDSDVGMGGQGGRGELMEAGEPGDAAEALPDMIDPADLELPTQPNWATARVEDLLREFALLTESYIAIETSLVQEADRIDNTPLINPVDHVDAWISSGYGYRSDPFSDRRRFHEGVDIVAPRGSTLLAPANGTVTYAGWKSGLGKLIVIKHGFGFETEYAHCDRLAVTKGEKVLRGQIIGHLGSTGRSTGPHLHYEVRKSGKLVNPYRYIIN